GSGVAEVLVHYVPEGAGEWTTASLGVGEDGQTWTVEVPAEDVKAGNFAYFLEAKDGSPAANVSYDPDQGGDDPHLLAVQDSTVVRPNPSSGGGCGASTASGGLAPTSGAAALAGVLAAMLLAALALGARRRGRAVP
ncbi:MAG: hypothetical protein FJ087_07840, partial [Deltaproteobacteria bacterium]|nr:hypothetical protein [Deltaproteobacteria bacterium]